VYCSYYTAITRSTIISTFRVHIETDLTRKFALKVEMKQFSREHPKLKMEVGYLFAIGTLQWVS
jgi:hypothetical protein